MTLSPTPLLIGLGLALTVGVGASVLRLDRDRAMYPLTLMIVASYNVLFAVMGAREVLVAEVGLAAVFVVAAVVGFRGSLWIVAAGLAAHGVLDGMHDAIVPNAGVPVWWPPFCLAYDVAAGAYLSWRLTRRRQLMPDLVDGPGVRERAGGINGPR